MSAHKHRPEVVTEAQRQGWTIEKRNNGHLVWISPQGDRVWSSATPGDHRAHARHLSLLRRYGYRG